MRCTSNGCGGTQVWQVAASSEHVPFARLVDLQPSRLHPGKWQDLGAPGVPAEMKTHGAGFYCVRCKAVRWDVGSKHPELHGEVPRPGQGAASVSGSANAVRSSFDLDAAVRILQRAMPDRAGPPLTVGTRRAAQFVDISSISKLSPVVRALLKRPLYAHQATAIQAGISRKNVVISTDTASGKSLCYQTVAAHLLAPKLGTVLYLSPINALVADQLESIWRFFGVNPGRASEASIEAYMRHVSFGEAPFAVARYDGAVPREPREIRQEIRKACPRFVLTTADMLAQALLPFASGDKGPEVKSMAAHSAWTYFFKSLRLVILDELHAFRGVFGAHAANVLRRVKRMVELCGGEAESVQFFACSATIKDPIGTARAITGAQSFELIGPEQDKSPRYRRILVPITTSGEPMVPFAARLLPAVAAEGGARTIAFRNHIPEVMGLGKLLGQNNALRGEVVTYCSGYKGEDKLTKLRSLHEGRIQCLISTSALELGIDVGSLNASVLLGYPGTISRTWQMLGRAGRTGDGLLVYVAGGTYLDEYWRTHADELLGEKAEPEDVIVDPDNPDIVQEHVRAAALDHAIEPTRDKRFFGPKFDEALAGLREDAVEGLRLEDEVWILRAAGEKRAREVSLHGLGQFRVPVYVGQPDSNILYEEEGHRASSRLFPGATFVWEDRYYRARTLNIPEADPRSRVRPKAYAVVDALDKVDYLTTARTSNETQIVDEIKRESAEIGWGRVNVTTTVEGYFKSTDLVGEIEGTVADKEKARYVPFEEDRRPPDRLLRTQGAWFGVPPGVIDGEPADFLPVLNTVAEALARAAPLLRFASPGDLQAYATLESSGFDGPVIFINETVAGGAGVARRVFELRGKLFAQAKKLLDSCAHCGSGKAKSNGCPRCVALADGTQDREGAVAALARWSTLRPTGSRKPAVTVGKPAKPKDLHGILESLGLENLQYVARGGMGQVWHGERDGEDVAIKLVTLTRRAVTVASAELQKEAKRLKRLKHPNIIRLRDVHQVDLDVILELDWAEGGTLYDYLEEEPSAPERIAVWRQVVGAVAYMHAQKIVHRDLKPANILMREGAPVITDFGIARDLSTERRTTMVIGTLDWMAPEQMTPGVKVAATMDVYSLGRLLNFLLTGEEGPSDKLPADLPKDLRPIVERCLAKNPKDRFPDAEALLATLKPAAGPRRKR